MSLEWYTNKHETRARRKDGTLFVVCHMPNGGFGLFERYRDNLGYHTVCLVPDCDTKEEAKDIAEALEGG